MPSMTLTLMRRASALQPRNCFVFRCAPVCTKFEIKQYLTKIYGVDVERVATINYLGAPPATR